MPARVLPSNPDLEFYRKEAKALVKHVAEGNREATARLAVIHGSNSKIKGKDQGVSLSDAQFVIAREHGFESWTKFKEHIEVSSMGFEEKVQVFINFATLGRLDAAEAIVKNNPDIAKANIHTAAIVGDVVLVERLLTKNPSLRDQKAGRKNMTPLLCACHSRYLGKKKDHATGIVAVIRLLLAKGADANSFFLYTDDPWPDTKESALYGAAGVNNHPEATKVLLDAGANPNDGESLYHSTEHNDHACMKLLLEHGAKVDPSNALKRKLDFEDYEGIKLLLDYKADPNFMGSGVEDRVGDAAVHHAIRRGRSAKVIKLLIEYGADINLMNKEGDTPFALAMRLGRKDIVEELVHLGVKQTQNHVDEFLHACAIADRKQVQSILAANPGVIGTLSPKDHRVLYYAASENNASAVEVMLEAGLDMTVQGDSGETPLHSAAFFGHIETVRALLAFNPPLEDTRNMHQGTVLGWAIYGATHYPNPKGDHFAVIKALIGAGSIVHDYMPGMASEEIASLLKQ